MTVIDTETSEAFWTRAKSDAEKLLKLRAGEYKPIERMAKQWAGGVGHDDNQEWIPARTEPRLHDADGERYLVQPVMTPVIYPKGKNRQTRIPRESDWTPISYPPECYPVCRHTGDQCPSHPAHGQEPVSWNSYIPDPEGNELPNGEVVNKMDFDGTGLDSAPLEVQAKAGYTNFGNDSAAMKKAIFVSDDQERWYRAKKDGARVGTWAEEDRERTYRYASMPKAADASQPPPGNISHSLQFFPGRQCRNCLGRLPADAHGRVRYCSERCRNRGEYVRRHSQAGTMKAGGVELTTFSVDGKRIGIDTDDLGFVRLLEHVT